MDMRFDDVKKKSETEQKERKNEEKRRNTNGFAIHLNRKHVLEV